MLCLRTVQIQSSLLVSAVPDDHSGIRRQSPPLPFVPQRPMARDVLPSVEHESQAPPVRAADQGSLQMTANGRVPAPCDVPTT